MTYEEKLIIAKVLTHWNWHSYTGGKDLQQKWDRCYNDYPHADPYESDIITKSKMLFVNKFFPMFVKHWNLNRKEVERYLNSMKEKNRSSLYEIMNKYYYEY